MTLIEKLDKLMAEKNINKHELSTQSGIPYMTIVNFYEKGTDNVKLSTLKKLSSFFNVSLDYLADGGINNESRNSLNEINKNTPNAEAPEASQEILSQKKKDLLVKLTNLPDDILMELLEYAEFVIAKRNQ